MIRFRIGTRHLVMMVKVGVRDAFCQSGSSQVKQDKHVCVWSTSAKVPQQLPASLTKPSQAE